MFRPSPDPAAEGWESPVGAAIAEPAVPELIAMFGLRACWFESFPFEVQLPCIEPGRIVLPPEEPGIAPWAGEAGVALPVRHDDLTLGRYVLVPAAPTSGVALSATTRARAIAMAGSVGSRIAAEIISESEGIAPPSNREMQHRAPSYSRTEGRPPRRRGLA